MNSSVSPKSPMILTTIVCVVAAAVAVYALGLRAGTPANTGLNLQRYGMEGLRVSGTALVRTAPEVATVTLGYESRNRAAREAKVKNDSVMKKVLAAIKEQGVADKDIQTVEYRLFPIWENLPPSPRVLTWHVLHMVEVRVRKVATVADVIDAASKAGADKVNNVEFSVVNLHKLRAKAREMASKVAKEKAEQLAKLMGAKLGKIVTIEDRSIQNYPYRWRYDGGYSPNRVAQSSTEMPSSATGPESVVSGGQVAVEAREEVVFALE